MNPKKIQIVIQINKIILSTKNPYNKNTRQNNKKKVNKFFGN